MIDPIRGSIWQSNINTILGIGLIGSCALLASYTILNVASSESALAARIIQLNDEDLNPHTIQLIKEEAERNSNR